MKRKMRWMLNALMGFCILMIFVMLFISERILANGMTVLESILEGLILIQLLSEVMIIAVLRKSQKNKDPEK